MTEVQIKPVLRIHPVPGREAILRIELGEVFLRFPDGVELQVQVGVLGVPRRGVETDAD